MMRITSVFCLLFLLSFSSCLVWQKKTIKYDFNTVSIHKFKNGFIEKIYYGKTQFVKCIMIYNKRSNDFRSFSYYSDGNIMAVGQLDYNSKIKDSLFCNYVWLQDTCSIGIYSQYEFSSEYKKTGNWTYYYSNGVPQIIGNYHQNKKNGSWRFFSSMGNLEIIRIYDQGKVIKDSIVANESYVTPPE